MAAASAGQPQRQPDPRLPPGKFLPYKAPPPPDVPYSPIELHSDDIFLSCSSEYDSDNTYERKSIKRRKLGQDWLQGKQVPLISTSLRGPLKNNWKSPWADMGRDKKKRRPSGRDTSPIDLTQSSPINMGKSAQTVTPSSRSLARPFHSSPNYTSKRQKQGQKKGTEHSISNAEGPRVRPQEPTPRSSSSPRATLKARLRHLQRSIADALDPKEIKSLSNEIRQTVSQIEEFDDQQANFPPITSKKRKNFDSKKSNDKPNPKQSKRDNAYGPSSQEPQRSTRPPQSTSAHQKSAVKAPQPHKAPPHVASTDETSKLRQDIYQWPEKYRRQLARLTKRFVESHPANSSKTINSDLITLWFLRRWSFHTICQGLAEKGFVIDKTSLARILLKAMDIIDDTDSVSQSDRVSLKLDNILDVDQTTSSLKIPQPVAQRTSDSSRAAPASRDNGPKRAPQPTILDAKTNLLESCGAQTTDITSSEAGKLLDALDTQEPQRPVIASGDENESNEPVSELPRSRKLPYGRHNKDKALNTASAIDKVKPNKDIGSSRNSSDDSEASASPSIHAAKNLRTLRSAKRSDQHRQSGPRRTDPAESNNGRSERDPGNDKVSEPPASSDAENSKHRPKHPPENFYSSLLVLADGIFNSSQAACMSEHGSSDGESLITIESFGTSEDNDNDGDNEDEDNDDHESTKRCKKDSKSLCTCGVQVQVPTPSRGAHDPKSLFEDKNSSGPGYRSKSKELEAIAPGHDDERAGQSAAESPPRASQAIIVDLEDSNSDTESEEYLKKLEKPRTASDKPESQTAAQKTSGPPSYGLTLDLHTEQVPSKLQNSTEDIDLSTQAQVAMSPLDTATPRRGNVIFGTVSKPVGAVYNFLFGSSQKGSSDKGEETPTELQGEQPSPKSHNAAETEGEPQEDDRTSRKNSNNGVEDENWAEKVSPDEPKDAQSGLSESEFEELVQSFSMNTPLSHRIQSREINKENDKQHIKGGLVTRSFGSTSISSKDESTGPGIKPLILASREKIPRKLQQSTNKDDIGAEGSLSTPQGTLRPGFAHGPAGSLEAASSSLKPGGNTIRSSCSIMHDAQKVSMAFPSMETEDSLTEAEIDDVIDDATSFLNTDVATQYDKLVTGSQSLDFSPQRGSQSLDFSPRPGGQSIDSTPRPRSRGRDVSTSTKRKSQQKKKGRVSFGED